MTAGPAARPQTFNTESVEEEVNAAVPQYPVVTIHKYKHPNILKVQLRSYI